MNSFRKLKTIYKLSRQAFGNYKKRILALIGLGFLGGLLEGIGVNALIPLLSSVTKSGPGDDFITRNIEKFFKLINVDFSLKQILVFISVLFVLKAIVLLYSSYIKAKITTGYIRDIRNKLLGKTLKARWPYLQKQKIGYLEAILKQETNKSGMLLNLIAAFFMSISTLVVYIIIAFNISAYIAATTLVLGGFLLLLLRPLIARTKNATFEVARVNRESANFINESVTGLKTVKAMQLEKTLSLTGQDYYEKDRALRVKLMMFKSVTGQLLQPISIIFIAILFAVIYKTDPTFNIAEFAAIIYLIQRMFQYIKQMQTQLQAMGETYPYLRNVLDYEKELDKNLEKDEATGKFKLDEKLAFQNVHFSYDNDQAVLKDVSFTIPKGGLVGLIGPSGAGKTTIVDLLLRLHNPQSGRITIDGQDVQNVSLEEWRGNVGYVSQDIFLKNDTIANNIKFYDKDITEEKMIEAAKMANIHDTIQGFAKGYETVVGDQGQMLSAGQRQRVVIARVLARDPRLLILDEATSALDNESEVKIQKVIEGLKGKMTVFAIAHRLSTVRNVDKLLVLEKGIIEESDTPDKLLEDKDSYFYKMYNIRK
jgi:ABC-type multidrug transport system fused ATPase/permease subunit